MHDAPLAGPLVMTALLTTRREKQEELQQALGSLLIGIRTQAGCLECMVGRDLEGEPRFHIHLRWKDGRALEAFMVSDVFRILLGAVNVLASPTAFRIVAERDAFTPIELNKGPEIHRRPTSLHGPP